MIEKKLKNLENENKNISSKIVHLQKILNDEKNLKANSDVKNIIKK